MREIHKHTLYLRDPKKSAENRQEKILRPFTKLINIQKGVNSNYFTEMIPFFGV